MFEPERATIFLAKAIESLAGAESEFANRRFNNCANRCYYVTFQAAIAALLRQGIQSGAERTWGHSFVQAQFAGTLVNRSKLYPAGLRDTLPQNLMLRQRADYEEQHITEIQAQRALRHTRAFLGAVRSHGRERL
jgi:uncharacterized protein (UPF0332 family)